MKFRKRNSVQKLRGGAASQARRRAKSAFFEGTSKDSAPPLPFVLKLAVGIALGSVALSMLLRCMLR